MEPLPDSFSLGTQKKWRGKKGIASCCEEGGNVIGRYVHISYWTLIDRLTNIILLLANIIIVLVYYIKTPFRRSLYRFLRSLTVRIQRIEISDSESSMMHICIGADRTP